MGDGVGNIDGCSDVGISVGRPVGSLDGALEVGAGAGTSEGADVGVNVGLKVSVIRTKKLSIEPESTKVSLSSDDCSRRPLLLVASARMNPTSASGKVWLSDALSIAVILSTTSAAPSPLSRDIQSVANTWKSATIVAVVLALLDMPQVAASI